MNDYQIKIIKIERDFEWHDHQDTDETFIVLEVTLRIDFRDGHVTLNSGEMYVVPNGVEHKLFAYSEVKNTDLEAFLIQVILRLPAEPQRMMYGYRFANTSLRWFFDAGSRSLNSNKSDSPTGDYE
jgi:hypothetical protein